MKIHVLHTAEQPEDGDFDPSERAAAIRAGYNIHHLERRTVSFNFGAQLLFYVYREIYGVWEDAFKVRDPHWMSDDFFEYVDQTTGKPAFYLHYAHGDCDFTYFIIE